MSEAEDCGLEGILDYKVNSRSLWTKDFVFWQTSPISPKYFL